MNFIIAQTSGLRDWRIRQDLNIILREPRYQNSWLIYFIWLFYRFNFWQIIIFLCYFEFFVLSRRTSLSNTILAADAAERFGVHTRGYLKSLLANNLLLLNCGCSAHSKPLRASCACSRLCFWLSVFVEETLPSLHRRNLFGFFLHLFLFLLFLSNL